MLTAPVMDTVRIPRATSSVWNVWGSSSDVSREKPCLSAKRERLFPRALSYSVSSYNFTTGEIAGRFAAHAP